MRKQNQIIAVVCADLHLSLKPPIARAGEPDWFEAMARPLREMKELADYNQVPIFCAGDVFDRWNPPPELINFALRELPKMYAVAGQHDLPHHSHEQIKRSAFWTMVMQDRITVVPPEGIYVQCTDSGTSCMLYGFGWNQPVQKPDKKFGCDRFVALLHEYKWLTSSTGFVGAMAEQRISHDPFLGFKTVIIGDNHRPFEVEAAQESTDGCYVFNCGGFMRRKSDDAHAPRIGVLFEDGRVRPHPLNTSKDVFVPVVQQSTKADAVGMEAFFHELRTLQGATLDYVAALKDMMKSERLSPGVRALLVAALEENDGGNGG